MIKAFATVLAFCLLAPLPASAQWFFFERGDTARAYVTNGNGNELALRCTSRQGDQQDMFLDLTVTPIVAQPDQEEVARFRVGTWTFTIETIFTGDRRNGLPVYQSRVGFYDDVPSNIRRQLAAGSVARFEQVFDFAAMSFGLRGSRNAISQLEAACPRLWAASSRPQPQPQPIPQPAPQPALPPAASGPSTVPPEALAALQSYIRTTLEPQCADPARLILAPNMFLATGDQIRVNLSLARCNWRFGTNPYCTGGRCQTWLYRYNEAGQFDLLGTQ